MALSQQQINDIIAQGQTDLGVDVLNRVIDMLSDIAEVEKHGELEGRRQTIVLTGK